MNEDAPGWAAFFDAHAAHYMENSFTANTAAEVDFIIETLGLAPGAAVLDIGCGTGRHSVELARRGFAMTGVDISAGMLAQAEQAAARAGVVVTWVQADATQFRAQRTYDAAICLCEGAFSLLGLAEDPLEHDLAILRAIHAALRPGSPFLLTALNGLRIIRRATVADVEDGRFDPLSTTTLETMREGDVEVRVRERGYVPAELQLALRLAGFQTRAIWGGTAGNWGRRLPDMDEIELMALAVRP